MGEGICVCGDYWNLLGWYSLEYNALILTIPYLNFPGWH